MEYLKDFKDIRFQFYQQGRIINTEKMFKFFSLNSDQFKDGLYQLSESKNSGDYMVIIAEFIRLYLEPNLRFCSELILNNFLEFKKQYPNINLSKVNLLPRPKYMEDAKLNSAFRDRVINSVPKEFNTFEKAFYLFIKMCQTLSHDEHDFDKTLNCPINHADINRIQEIDENNNIIVCYEFVVILALFFEEFDIPYEIVYDQKYGRWHLGINVLYDNILINLEATLGIVDCDLVKIKNNIRAGGIFPYTCTLTEGIEIVDCMNRVYDHLEKEEKQKYYLENELVKHERQQIDNLLSLTDEQKFEMFKEKILSSSLKSIVDIFKCMEIWKKVFFFKKTTLVLRPVLKKIPQGTEKDYDVVILLNFQTDYEKYYFYSKQDGFQKMIDGQLLDYIENGIIKFIEEEGDCKNDENIVQETKYKC